MLNETLKDYKFYIILAIEIIVSLIIDYHISIGIILGQLAGILHQYILEKAFLKKRKKILTYIAVWLNYLIFVLPFLAAIPERSVSLCIGVAIGELNLKYYIYINELLRRKK